MVIQEQCNNLLVFSCDLLLDKLWTDDLYINSAHEIYCGHCLVLICLESNNFKKSDLANIKKMMIKKIIY